jgi:hypothetical protein
MLRHVARAEFGHLLEIIAMRSLRYLNCVLTVLAVLLSLQLWTTWNTSHASMVQEAHAQGIPNAGAQRKEMIDALNSIQRELQQTNDLLRSGQLRVVADQPRTDDKR